MLNPQSAILGFFDDNDDNAIRNYILLIFKYTLHKNRTKNMNKYIIINKIKSIFNIEKFLSDSTCKELDKKWNLMSLGRLLISGPLTDGTIQNVQELLQPI